MTRTLKEIALELLEKYKEAACDFVWASSPDFEEDQAEVYAECNRYKEAIESCSSHPEWIPVTERLPDEDKEVLITYKGKGDELDKPYSNIDITTYGQMYFGGNKVGNYKHWRSPFQYFYDNYEVTAWMPLPEVYRGERDDK